MPAQQLCPWWFVPNQVESFQARIGPFQIAMNNHNYHSLLCVCVYMEIEGAFAQWSSSIALRCRVGNIILTKFVLIFFLSRQVLHAKGVIPADQIWQKEPEFPVRFHHCQKSFPETIFLGFVFTSKRLKCKKDYQYDLYNIPRPSSTFCQINSEK